MYRTSLFEFETDNVLFFYWSKTYALGLAMEFYLRNAAPFKFDDTDLQTWTEFIPVQH